MKNRGFTLIEMIAAVVILGLLALIVMPLVEEAIDDVKISAYNAQVESIRSSAREWAADNISLLPDDDGDTYTLTLADLKFGGYAKNDLVNPQTKLQFSDALQITIINDNDNYVYAVGGESGSQIDPNTPRITVTGSTLTYVNQGNTYTDSGATAVDNDNNPLTNPTSVIYKDGSIVGSVSTTNLDTYQIVYTSTRNVSGTNYTAKAVRTVIVKDTTPPVLTIPSDATIDDSITSYNIMTGVSASDTSGYAPVITTKTNLTLGVVGRYLVVYTATDKAGNVTTKERVITIQY